MPHRALREAMLARVTLCCSTPGDAEKVVDDLTKMGVRPPAPVVTEVADLDAIPEGAAVVVGDPRNGSRGRVGVKLGHAIWFGGDDEPYPFNDPSLAPPLPCTVVWIPGEDADSASMGERMGELSRSLLLQGLDEAGGRP